MQTRRLGSGDLEVSAIGFGCMGMSWSYGPPKDKQEMISPLKNSREILGRSKTLRMTAKTKKS